MEFYQLECKFTGASSKCALSVLSKMDRLIFFEPTLKMDDALPVKKPFRAFSVNGDKQGTTWHSKKVLRESYRRSVHSRFCGEMVAPYAPLIFRYGL